MKAIYFFIITILFSNLTFCQNADTVVVSNSIFKLDSLILNAELNDSITKYYKYVSKAEKSVMRKKLEKAAKLYEKAFTYKKYPFAKDLLFAKYCEMNSRQNLENIKKYIWFNINKTGNKAGYLNDKENQMLSNWDEIRTMIDTMQPAVDTGLVMYLNHLLEVDQACRGLGENATKEQIEFMIYTDSINYYNLLKILDDYPNFSEEIYGGSWHSVLTILRHHWFNLDIYIKLHELLVNGQFDARVFASSLETSIYTIEDKYGIGQISHGIINRSRGACVYSYNPCSVKERKTINKYRKQLYLDDIKTFHKKCIWNFQNESIPYYFYNQNVCVYDSITFNKLVMKNIDGNDRKVKNYYKNEEDKKKIKKIRKAKMQ